MRLTGILCCLAVVSCALAGEGDRPQIAAQLLETGGIQLRPAVLDASQTPETLDLTWRLERLASGVDEPEVFETVADPEALGVSIDAACEQLDGDSWLIELTFRNKADESRMLRSLARLSLPAEPGRWWNGYLNDQPDRFDPDDQVLSKWFPLNAALDISPDGARPLGAGLGVHPRDVYSRVDTFSETKSERFTLVLGLPFVLEAGGSFTCRYVVTAFGSRYGPRDAVQRYYDLFPACYRPREDVDARLLGPETSLLGWKPEVSGVQNAREPIRRMTAGLGGWEWCYAPFVRGGDWAISDRWSVGFKNLATGGTWSEQAVENRRAWVRRRLAECDDWNASPIYYLNCMYSEQTLIEELCPEAIFDRTDLKCWGQPVTRCIYTGWNAFGELFLESLDAIFEMYPRSEGIAWDSAFGHRILSAEIEGVKRTPRRSFLRGREIALEGVGTARLLDRNHSHVRPDGTRMANVLNLKLVTPYFNHARTDAALYEGAPNNHPERFARIESMKTRLGSKMVGWHKGLVPSRVGWIEWDRLSPEQIEGAFRQVQHDALLMSYFWGACPAPYMPLLGVQRSFEAAPELASLVRQGWQASPKVAVDGRVLLARYGEGLGSRLAVINPGYEPREVELTAFADDWDARAVLWLRCDGEPLESTLTAEGSRMKVVVPSHEVLLLRAIGDLPAGQLAQAGPLDCETELRHGEMGLRTWVLNAATEASETLEMRFYRPADTARAELLHQGETTELPCLPQAEPHYAATLNTGRWNVPGFQSPTENRLRRGRYYVDLTPRVAVGVTAEQLAGAEFQEPDGTATTSALGCVLVDAGAEEGLLADARRLALWSPTDAGRDDSNVEPAVFPPSAAPQTDFHVRLAAVPAEAIAPHAARVRFDEPGGRIVIEAVDAESMHEAVRLLMCRLDAAYPWCGKLRGDVYLKKAGLAGGVLKKAPPLHVAGPTLEEWLDRAGLLPAAAE